MYCTNCGTQIPDGTMYCPSCGTQAGDGAYANQQSPYAQPYGQPAQQPFYVSPQYHAAESAATTSLVCGIVGVFVVGVILGIIAIVQSNKAKKLGYVGGKATAGLVLGIIDIVLGGIVALVVISSVILAASVATTYGVY